MPISKATLNDVPALAVLVNTAYRGKESLKGWATEAHLLDGIRIDEETLRGYFDNPAITMLKYTNETGQLEGCVYLEVKQEKLYLGMLCVYPHLQDKGIGRKLLQAAEEHAQAFSCEAITMTVISSRESLIEWYERRGYAKTGEVLPFHEGTRFGIPREQIQLLVLEKQLKLN